VAEQRGAELVQRCERQLHLGLHTLGAQDTRVIGACRHVVDQRGLADARLTTEHQCAAAPIARGGQQLVELRAFGSSTAEHPGRGYACRDAATGTFRAQDESAPLRG
jgi:hypothetical protein